MNKLYLILISLGLFQVANAVNTSNVVASGVTTSVSSVKTSSLQEFTIDSDEELSVQLLDNCWNNRENLANQKIIADYLMTKPKIPNNYEIAWKVARLVYFIGNYGIGEKNYVNTEDGVKLFDYGVSAGKIAMEAMPRKVEGYYWYAIDLGSYGLANGILSSASNAKDGMAALATVEKIDSSYQWNGSSRILGRYYEELPGIFGGDTKKAYSYLSKAVRKSSNFRNNWVFLGQYYISQGEYAKAINACKVAVNLQDQDGKFEEMRYSREARECIAKAKSKQ